MKAPPRVAASPLQEALLPGARPQPRQSTNVLPPGDLVMGRAIEHSLCPPRNARAVSGMVPNSLANAPRTTPGSWRKAILLALIVANQRQDWSSGAVGQRFES